MLKKYKEIEFIPINTQIVRTGLTCDTRGKSLLQLVWLLPWEPGLQGVSPNKDNINFGIRKVQ